MTQATTAAQRYWGRATSELIAGGVTKLLHPERFFVYHFTITGSDLTVKMPYDVRNYQPGVFLLLMNSTGSLTRDLLVRDNGGTAVPGAATVASGESAIIVLRDNSTAVGTWQALLKTSGADLLRT